MKRNNRIMITRNSTSTKTIAIEQDEDLKKMFAGYDKNVKAIFLFCVVQLALILAIV